MLCILCAFRKSRQIEENRRKATFPLTFFAPLPARPAEDIRDSRFKPVPRLQVKHMGRGGGGEQDLATSLEFSKPYLTSLVKVG